MIKPDRAGANFAPPPENTEVIRTDRDTLRRLMRSRLDRWYEDDKLKAWNSYCDTSNSGDGCIRELDWNELHYHYDSTSSFVADICKSKADYRHDYYSFDSYGMLRTFDYLSDENSPYDPDEIIDALIDSLSVPLEEAEQEWLYRDEDEDKLWGYAVYETADGNKMALRLTPFDDEEQELLSESFSETDVFGEEGDSLPENVWEDLNEEPKIKHVLASDILEAIGFHLEDSAPDLPWRERFDSGYAAAFSLFEALKRPCAGDVPCEKGGWHLSFDDTNGKNYICLYNYSGEAGKVWEEVLGREARRELLDTDKLYRKMFSSPASQQPDEGFSP